MELLRHIGERNEIFIYDEGLGEKVWESQPITRFEFKKPTSNEWLKDKLKANHPTAGIIFNNLPYIGTNEGFVYAGNEKIERIPEIFVDPELFFERYPFIDKSEREIFKKFKEEGVKKLDLKNGPLVNRIFKINEEFNTISHQEDSLHRYLQGYLNIRGFVISKDSHGPELDLYDGHLLGITKTLTGKIVNELAPTALYQIDSSRAGFVPDGYPPQKTDKSVIEKGLETRIDVSCVDYNSLWDLTGSGRFVKDICPRDGSGYAPAKFATDGKIIAISHGDHPFYSLDILEQKDNGIQEKIKSIDLDPHKLPTKLLILEESVIGDYGNSIRNFSTEKEIFSPTQGEISSLSDSGLCTVTNDKETRVYDFLNSNNFVGFKGNYVFLNRAPQ